MDNRPLRIVADENIPYVVEAFSTLGSVVTVPGRGITPADVSDTDLLLVRSVTQVGKTLLQNSPVRFVGSATIGTDHVDLEWLQAQQITFANAPGCNAESASEYVLSAALAVLQQRRSGLSGLSVGIIGCGNVGSRVLEKFTALGLHCLINDPPRARVEGRHDFVDLDTALGADIVTLHVPLTHAGPHATWHMLDAQRLQHLRPGTLLINTSRGPVVDNAALLLLLSTRDDLDVVLDVWEGEPDLNPDLLDKVRIGTPHIAGYSLDGKIRGTTMLYAAACSFLHVDPDWQGPTALPGSNPTIIRITDTESLDRAVTQAVHRCYDVRQDDSNLRDVVASTDPAGGFDMLRRDYRVRREFSSVAISPTNNPFHDLMRKLGFTIEHPVPTET